MALSKVGLPGAEHGIADNTMSCPTLARQEEHGARTEIFHLSGDSDPTACAIKTGN
jgi:hypothetical protein